ncbi:MAG: hypothetical protein WDO16_16810 [Bacteroidota bacterium]
MNVNGKILFEEVQQFRVKWLWAFIILCVLSSMGVTVGIALAEKEKAKDAWLALAFIFPLEAAMLYLFYIVKLEITISSEGIYYRWWPFQRNGRFIPKLEIEKAEMRTGPALSYGFHWVPGYGSVHNAGPGKGIQFTLQNGKKVFLGTQVPSSLQTALEKIMTVSEKV